MPNTSHPKNFKLELEKAVIPEKAREAAGTATLTMLGYTTKTLGKPIPVTCRNPKCRTFQWAKTTGNSDGVADVLCTHPNWRGAWIMLETKRTGGRRRSAQVDLAENGLSTFVTTEEDFVRAVIAAEERMELPVNPKLVNWLRINRKGEWVPESQLLN